jgi:hypothetical protein
MAMLSVSNNVRQKNNLGTQGMSLEGCGNHEYP